MIRFSHIIFFSMAVWCAFLLFWTSQSVQVSEKKLRELQRTVLHEQEYLRVLASEWDYLNRPERLEALAQQYLQDNGRQFTAGRKISDTNQLRSVLYPAIPKAKPENLLQYVSLQKEKNSPTVMEPKKIISKPEQDNFDDFMQRLSEEGLP